MTRHFDTSSVLRLALGLITAFGFASLVSVVAFAQSPVPDPEEVVSPVPDADTGRVRATVMAEPADASPLFTVEVAGSASDGDQIQMRIRSGETADFYGTSLDAGQYVVALDPTSGWILTSVDCQETMTSTAQPGALVYGIAIDLEPGEDVLCRFRLIKDGAITVALATDGPGASVSLDFEVVVDDEVDQVSWVGTATPGSPWTAAPLTPEARYVVEVLTPPDRSYAIDDIECVGADASVIDLELRAATLDIGPGQEPICTFSLITTGTLEVMLIADPDEPPISQPYEVVGVAFGDWPAPEGTIAGTVSTTEPAREILEPGPYQVSSSPGSGWRPVFVLCSVGRTSDMPFSGIDRDQILVSAGNEWRCVFAVAQDASVTLAVTADSEEADVALDFVLSRADATDVGSWTVSSEESLTLEGLEPRSEYVVSIASDPDPSWVLRSVFCGDERPPTSLEGAGAAGLDSAQSKLRLSLAPGERLTCTFDVVTTGELRVGLAATPADAVVTAQVDLGHSDGVDQPASNAVITNTQMVIFSDLVADRYHVSLGLEDGWTISGLECPNAPETIGDSDTATAGRINLSIDLAAASEVTCLVEATQDGTITVSVVADPPASTATTGFSIAAPGSAVIAGSASTAGPVTVSPLEAGVPYQVSPAKVTGQKWTTRKVSCIGTTTSSSGQPPSASVTLAPGENVACTFTVDDRILPKPGRWHGDAKNHQGCIVGGENRSGFVTIAVKGGGRKLEVRQGRSTLKGVRDPKKKENVYKGSIGGFELVWNVESEERITGTVRFKRGNCVTSTITYKYRGD